MSLAVRIGLALVPVALFFAAPGEARAVTMVPASYTYAAGYGPVSYLDSGNELNDDVKPGPYPPGAPYVDGQSNGLVPIFDFGSAATLDLVEVWVYGGDAANYASGIGTPQFVKVAFSDDGTTFANEQTYTLPYELPGTTGTISFALSGAASARTGRYARVNIGPPQRYTHIFVGEVDFQGGGSPVPEPSALAALAVTGALALGSSRRRGPPR